jgi:DNA-directed RNA polymerase subunit H (RpoH/RPB5)
MVHKSLDIVDKMLTYRGIDTVKMTRYSPLELSSIVEQFGTKDINITFDLILNDDTKIIYVLGKMNVNILTEYMEQNKRSYMILVHQSSLTPKNQLTIGQLFKEFIKVNKEAKDDRNFDYQVFSLQDLQFDRSCNKLVPKHEIVPKDQVKDLMKRYNVKNRTQFPLLNASTDQMGKFINAKPGDVVKITSPSISAGEYISYRYCL